MVLVVYMVETLKATGFYNVVIQWEWSCATHSSIRKTKLKLHQSGDNIRLIEYLIVRKTDRCEGCEGDFK